MSNQNTCWDGKAVNVGQAWVNLATLIMKLGCDPRLPDHSNRCPDEIARLHANVPLADEMLQVTIYWILFFLINLAYSCLPYVTVLLYICLILVQTCSFQYSVVQDEIEIN